METVNKSFAFALFFLSNYFKVKARMWVRILITVCLHARPTTLNFVRSGFGKVHMHMFMPFYQNTIIVVFCTVKLILFT